RGSTPPLVASLFFTEKLSGSPSILVMVPGPVFPSAPATTATTSTSAELLPVIFTAFWVAYFFPSCVLTFHPLGTVSSQSKKKQLCVNVTVPLDGVAAICFWPVGVPGRFCDSSA